MINALSWMTLDTARDLGWTLIHFVWQGAALAALLHVLLPLCRSATLRHNLSLGVLGLMVLAPFATFLMLHDAGGAVTLLAAAPLTAAFAPGMSTLVVLWLVGVAVFSLRALGGWYLVQTNTRRDMRTVPDDLLRRCQQQQRRLAVTWPVRFVLSRRISVPVVIGWLRPVIVIPVSAVSGLSPQQLDALILHELAHIRRFDTFINIALVAAETILFYHPAVWWVCRQVRIEREHCCDDIAVSACGDAALYAEALTSLDGARIPGGLALAANGGKLKNRVARLLDAPQRSQRVSLSALTGLALLGLVAGSVAVAQANAPAKKPVTTDLRPVTETRLLPPYPKESIKLHEEGTVTLSVTIGTNGAVSKASVFKASGHQRLDAAASQFVKDNWRWYPATRAGKPVAATTRVAVHFKLKPKPEAPAKL